MKFNLQDIMNTIREACEALSDTSGILLAKPGLLKESGLSRLYQHMQEHDSAILTAHRADPSDMSLCASKPTDIPTDATNQLRNRDLKATLLAMGIGVTKVDGSYIENFDTPSAMEVSEDSLFCTNLKDDPNFAKIIQELGKKYCQDSILIIPQGAKGAYLYGTNNGEFPGLDQSITVGDAKFGEDAEFMSRVRRRPLTFKEEKLEVYEDLSRNQRMAVKTIAQPFINEMKKKI
jgi:hypothetical protein